MADGAAPVDVSLDPAAFPSADTDVRGFRQVLAHLGAGGVPLLLVHGWPETRRIWWRNVGALADAGFEVIAPDLRGFGDSDAPDGPRDVPVHSRDLHALVHEALGHPRCVAVGGDLGGVVVQDLALRFPGFVERMVLFNTVLAFDPERMAGLRTRAPAEASDYFVRQGTDPDALAAELATPDERRRYIATFYTSRFWAHPGSFGVGRVAGRFGASAEVDFHTEPFADATKLRASFGAYESAFDDGARSEPTLLGRNADTPTLVLFGPSDHVLYPDFDRMAEATFDRVVGPFLLRDCGHFVQWEAAAVLNRAVVAFCEALLQRTAVPSS
jgi:pimeloyl-ACP methyl ester carboxylesterase